MRSLALFFLGAPSLPVHPVRSKLRKSKNIDLRARSDMRPVPNGLRPKAPIISPSPPSPHAGAIIPRRAGLLEKRSERRTEFIAGGTVFVAFLLVSIGSHPHVIARPRRLVCGRSIPIAGG